MWSVLILIMTRKAESFFTFLPKNEAICIALKVKANRQEEHLSGRNEPFSTVMGRSSSLRSVSRGTECPLVTHQPLVSALFMATILSVSKVNLSVIFVTGFPRLLCSESGSKWVCIL